MFRSQDLSDFLNMKHIYLVIKGGNVISHSLSPVL